MNDSFCSFTLLSGCCPPQTQTHTLKLFVWLTCYMYCNKSYCFALYFWFNGKNIWKMWSCYLGRWETVTGIFQDFTINQVKSENMLQPNSVNTAECQTHTSQQSNGGSAATFTSEIWPWKRGYLNKSWVLWNSAPLSTQNWFDPWPQTESKVLNANICSATN